MILIPIDNTFVVGTIDHDALLNFAANEHIDWTNASDDLITTGYLRFGTYLKHGAHTLISLDGSVNLLIGEGVGGAATGYHTITGHEAGNSLSSATWVDLLYGYRALKSCTSGSADCVFSIEGFENATNVNQSGGMGHQIGRQTSSVDDSWFFGHNAGYNLDVVDNVLLFGTNSGKGTSSYNLSDAIIFGPKITPTDDMFYLHTSDSAAPMFIGNMSSMILRTYAELSIKYFEQDAEPTLSADSYMATWKDTNDSDKIYLIFRRGSGDQVKVELT